MRVIPLASIAAACASFIYPHSAYAQEQSASASGDARGIEEIVVTARKREESLQDAPLTVQALSRERIEQFDITNLERIQSVTPQLYVGRSPTGPGAQITMRGIGASSSTSIGIEQSVAVIMNGAYYGQGRVLNEGMFDLGQIEILKGPQSLFFGKNATAGVISIRTAEPTEELEIIGRLGYETETEQMQYEGIISGPITDTMGARLAVRHREMDEGHFRNVAGQQSYTLQDVATGTIINDLVRADSRDMPAEEETFARLTVTLDPNDALSMVFAGQISDVEVLNAGFNQVYFSCAGGVALSGNGCGEDFVVAHNPFPSTLVDALPYGKDELYNDYESYSLNLEIDYSFGKFTLSSVTNYQDNENTWALDGDLQSIPSGIFVTENTTWKAFSQELRLSTEFDGQFNYMLGFLYQETERELGQWVNFAFAGWNSAVPDPSLEFMTYFKDSYTDGKTISPFFQLTYALTDTVEVTAGARYTDETKDSAFSQPYVHLIGQLFLNWAQGTIEADQDFEEWSPEATISWHLNDEINLYAAYKTAYKSGGFSNGSILSGISLVSDFTFNPETAEGFEIGMKSTLIDNQLRFNATIFSYEYDDLQLDYFNAAAFSFITLNAGKATSEGVEFDLEFAPINLPGLTLRGTIAYNDAKYDEFIAPCWDGQTAATGCNSAIPGTVGLPAQDISGEKTGMAPKWSASAGFSYDGSFGNGWTFGLAADVLYSDDYNASALGHPFAWRDSHSLINASAYIAGQEERWALQILGKNLTDEMVISGLVEGPGSGAAAGRAQADLAGYAGPGRTLSVQLTVRL